MSMVGALRRESAFMLRDRALIIAVLMTLVLSSVAVIGGILEVGEQRHIIKSLQLSDQEERTSVLSEQSDWGSAAYYSFHFTYDPPTDFAFTALGQRDSTPWKHRIRMLALEGQIYERDAGNPVFALIGRFDFAFFAAFVLPLILIALLHDMRAREREAGRHDLLVATAAESGSLWSSRATVRSLAVFFALIVPLLIAGVISNAAMPTLLLAILFVALYIGFWTVVIYRFSASKRSSPEILALLIGAWLLLAVIIPTGGRIAINHVVQLPSGSDVLLTQREAVNDAWDLPKAATMEPFLERHPQWASAPAIKKAFEWKWYYAFQQVGDQRAESLANSYRDGKQRRDQLAGFVALIAPPALLERSLQALAHTDTDASIEYEMEVRKFHAALREYYYPKLFLDQEFDLKALTSLPIFLASK